MANKTKKISVNAFEKAAAAAQDTITIDWCGLSVLVKTRLNLHDMLSFVDAVTKSCFKEDDASYLPEVCDFAIRDSVVEYYTNLSMPADASKRYDLVYSSTIVDDVLTHVDQKQYGAMVSAIHSKIEHIANANIQAVYKQMNDIYASFENLQETAQQVFDGVDHDALANMMAAMKDGFDERKIVDAVLAARADQE